MANRKDQKDIQEYYGKYLPKDLRDQLDEDYDFLNAELEDEISDSKKEIIRNLNTLYGPDSFDFDFGFQAG